MAIDNCQYSFEKLADSIFPSYYSQVIEKLKSPRRMEDFAKPGIGERTMLKTMGLDTDFPGCYVFSNRGTPVYVGISRGVIKRLSQHVKGNTHNDASLAYKMAFSHAPHEDHRGQAMKNSEFRRMFDLAKREIGKFYVAYIRIDNDLELHLFEAYCAMKLDTSTWNTFATH